MCTRGTPPACQTLARLLLFSSSYSLLHFLTVFKLDLPVPGYIQGIIENVLPHEALIN